MSLSCPHCHLALGHRALTSEYCPRCLVRHRTAVHLIPHEGHTRGLSRPANTLPSDPGPGRLAHAT
jgi:hypothetical protein